VSRAAQACPPRDKSSIILASEEMEQVAPASPPPVADPSFAADAEAMAQDERAPPQDVPQQQIVAPPVRIIEVPNISTAPDTPVCLLFGPFISVSP